MFWAAPIAAVAAVLAFTPTATAKIEWEVEKTISLEAAPLDMAITKDGATAYILSKGAILVYSIREQKTTDTIPVKGEFVGISIAPDGESLFLTDVKQKQITVIRISEVFDIAVGGSPVIGKAEASVSVVAFLDYQ